MSFIITLIQIKQLKSIIYDIFDKQGYNPQFPKPVSTNVLPSGKPLTSSPNPIANITSSPVNSIPKSTNPPTPQPTPEVIQPCVLSEKPDWLRYGSQGGPGYSTNIKMLKDYTGWDENITNSEKCIMKCGTESEGGAFDAVQGFDNQIITAGAMQKTVDPSGFGQLPHQLADFKKNNPEKYEELFGKKGIIIKKEMNSVNSKNENRLYYKDPNDINATEATGDELKKIVNQNGSKDEWLEEKNTLLSNKFTSIFREAGSDSDFQKQQVKDIRIQMNAALAKKPLGYNYPVSEFMSSDKGRATIFDQHINKPAYVTKDIGNALDRFFESNPRVSKNPAEWGENRALYEASILEDYGTKRRGTDMEKRFDKIKQCEC